MNIDIRSLSAALVLLCLSACQEDKPAAARGAAGESCAARSDCEAALVCLDNRCLPSGATNLAATNQVDGGVADTRGSVGESCTRRADCALHLQCITNICVEMASKPSDMQSPLGERGESCQARNDCASGLACVMNRCVLSDNPVMLQTKQCFREQCTLDEECCKSFAEPINCPAWKTSCAAGNSTACMSYDANCVCNMQCTNSACLAVRKCTMESDCTPFGQHCVGATCSQCAVDSDCGQPSQRCVSGMCHAGCMANEQCPLFSECKDKECVSVGCKSDRECYFATKSPLARCTNSECITPCETDTQCPELQVCDSKRCKFVGCETNDECRVFLGLGGQAGGERAVCRLPEN